MKHYTIVVPAFIFVLCTSYGKGKYIHVDRNYYSNVSFVPDDISKEQFLVWSQLASNLSAMNIPLEDNKG